MSAASSNGPHPIPTSISSRATSNSIINSLPDHSSTDPTTLCSICKDPFIILTKAKILPCTHFYHSHCILPWLQINNSCPLCRFNLSSSNFDEQDSLFVQFVNQHMDRARRNFQIYEQNNDIVASDNNQVPDWGVGNAERSTLIDQQYGDWVRGTSSSTSRVYVGDDGIVSWDEDVDVVNHPRSSMN